MYLPKFDVLDLNPVYLLGFLLLMWQSLFGLSPKRWTTGSLPRFWSLYRHSEQPCCKHLYASSPPTPPGIISLEMDFLKWVYWVKGAQWTALQLLAHIFQIAPWVDLTNGAGRRRQECGQAAAPLTAHLPPPPPQKKAQQLEVCGGKAVFLWPLSFFSWSGVEAQLGRTTIKGGAARYWAVPGRLPWGEGEQAALPGPPAAGLAFHPPVPRPVFES